MELSWKILDKYFNDNPNIISKHHLDSYNKFFSEGITQIFREKNPIRFFKEQNPITKNYHYKCNLYLGGKDGTKLYFGKPIIYDKKSCFMYPNEARLKNMTYGFSIHYDVDVEFTILNDEGEPIETDEPLTLTLEKINLGRFPIMLQSDLCILKGLNREIRFNMGECRNDPGGYFIIDGKEKVILCQEKFADNMLYIREKANDVYSHSAEIKSVSEDASKPVRNLSIRIVAPQGGSTNNQIVVNIPNVRKPVPLFILMRALGVISDKEIIKHCLLDLEKNRGKIDFFRPCVHDAGYIFTQEAALKYIGTLTKGKTVSHVLDILMQYFVPHIGELNFKQKALYLGYIVNRLLRVYYKEEKSTDRDNFKFKRIELSGTLIAQLFKEYYTLQQRNIFLKIDKEYFYSKTKSNVYQGTDFISLIKNNVANIFSDRIVEEGFRKAFKGNWGAQSHTKRLGVVQDLNRLSFWSFICHLRKLNLPFDKGSKVVAPRLLHGTQWGIICPIHTPDGGNVGLHKHMAMLAHITEGESMYPLIPVLKEMGMKLLEECDFKYLSTTTKIILNGAWIGVVENPTDITSTLRLKRRNSLIPIFTSIYWDIAKKEIIIFTDAGRPCHPLFYINNNKPSFVTEHDLEAASWKKCIEGFVEPEKNKDLLKNAAVIEYIDTFETEGSFIALSAEDIKENITTHIEIHPSVILGIMANQIAFPENNPLPRDLFSCGQSKQAVSLYHSNYQNRIDKSGLILNYGQVPLVKSRYLKYLTKEEHPYGMNAIVAIMCYSGYNVEDAVIMNKAALDRGLFRTTYFNMYEAREESSTVDGKTTDSYFCNIQDKNVGGLKPSYDYSHLDSHGLIRENTPINEKMVVIGKCTVFEDEYIDSSVAPKKGQLGFVDKSFMTEGEEGFRLAKVRVRHERIPAMGDKFSSRVGQKGTIGLILPEEDMPFTEDGIRPDIIVNPHAFPSRMTIGQLIEALMGKACLHYGGFGDCTAFVNKGPKDKVFGEMLTNLGFHSSGNQVLYSGMDGKQLKMGIFFGPTYYMRLKHMVKDKINYRARGPRTLLTRQTVQGRANNGGLRIGEMDRDALIGHGMNFFVNESFLVRGDDYYMAVCNKTGVLAIYNESKNIFLSPMADGPIKFVANLENELNIEKISKFGRDFSIVRVPFAFKLLYQELKTMNIQMRIITEKNVNQQFSLVKGDDVEKLTDLKNINGVHKKIIEKLKEQMHKPIMKEIIHKKQIYTPPPTKPDMSFENDIFAPPSKPDLFGSEKLVIGENLFVPPGVEVIPEEDGEDDDGDDEDDDGEDDDGDEDDDGEDDDGEDDDGEDGPASSPEYIPVSPEYLSSPVHATPPSENVKRLWDWVDPKKYWVKHSGTWVKQDPKTLKMKKSSPPKYGDDYEPKSP